MTQLVLMRIAPWPAGRMLAILYLVLGILFTPLMLMYALFTPEAAEYRAFSLVMTIFMPFLYALIGLFTGLIGGALYNLFAKMFGGVPFGFEAARVPSPGSAGTPAVPRAGSFGE